MERGGITCWGKADGFDVFVSEDLENWEGPFEVFHNDGTFWADHHYWAPEVHPYDGAFYMFASFKKAGVCRGTQILKAESPMGPFHPHSDGPLTPRDWECLDGTLYLSAAGKPYMIFCHEWLQVHDGEIWAVPLSGDLKTTAGEPFLLLRGLGSARRPLQRWAELCDRRAVSLPPAKPRAGYDLGHHGTAGLLRSGGGFRQRRNRRKMAAEPGSAV